MVPVGRVDPAPRSRDKGSLLLVVPEEGPRHHHRVVPEEGPRHHRRVVPGEGPRPVVLDGEGPRVVLVGDPLLVVPEEDRHRHRRVVLGEVRHRHRRVVLGEVRHRHRQGGPGEGRPRVVPGGDLHLVVPGEGRHRVGLEEENLAGPVEGSLRADPEGGCGRVVPEEGCWVGVGVLVDSGGDFSLMVYVVGSPRVDPEITLRARRSCPMRAPLGHRISWWRCPRQVPLVRKGPGRYWVLRRTAVQRSSR